MKFAEHGPNESPIAELFAYVSLDERGNEGICAMEVDNGLWLAMVTSKARIAEKMKATAANIAREGGMTVRLVRFEMREEMWSSDA